MSREPISDCLGVSLYSTRNDFPEIFSYPSFSQPTVSVTQKPMVMDTVKEAQGKREEQKGKMSVVDQYQMCQVSYGVCLANSHYGIHEQRQKCAPVYKECLASIKPNMTNTSRKAQMSEPNLPFS